MLILAIQFLFVQTHVLNGIDQTEKYFSLLNGKNVGIVINHSSLTQSGVQLYDILNSKKEIKIKSIFTPEHGLKGNWVDGESTSTNIKTVYNLYGKNKKPTTAQLSNIDVMIYDIQDVGLRFYTYISTLGYVMEACAEQNIPLIILDRLNILNGQKIDGPILDTIYKSFVGMYPIPIRYGMTIAELAKMIQGENWMKSMNKLDLTIIPIKNWKRNHDGSVLKSFIKPSPNIIDLEAVYLYSGLCLLEGTNISEGRGTDAPFKQIGSPWLKVDQLVEKLDRYKFVGVAYKTTEFTPISIKGKAYKPKYENELCKGLEISIRDKNKFKSIIFALTLIKLIQDIHPEFVAKNTLIKSNEFNFLNKLFGSNFLEKNLKSADFIDKVNIKLKTDISQFSKLRKKYLLYD